ncbi:MULTISPECIES: DUF3099 domain-containing protein [Streptomyces]|uniref:DUF3099 domain-containing protein n=1 Tax=Streptomyces TaxID=1883 RepID=UPI00136DBFFD|nr:DUF3099 domain-containing protein [Streptomyces sp. SID2888]MYV49183.1 DUF3099 domain-containing protein [Streptomyces sp. SID2888]
MRKLSGGGHGQVFRITGARQGLAEDVRGRQRRYVISMGVRTLSVILAATLWNVSRPVAIVALVLGAALPYVAVVIANAGRENAPSLPSTFVTSPSRPMIAPSADDTAAQPGGTEEQRDSAEPAAEAAPESAPEDAPPSAAGGGPRPRQRT